MPSSSAMMWWLQSWCKKVLLFDVFFDAFFLFVRMRKAAIASTIGPREWHDSIAPQRATAWHSWFMESILIHYDRCIFVRIAQFSATNTWVNSSEANLFRYRYGLILTFWRSLCQIPNFNLTGLILSLRTKGRRRQSCFLVSERSDPDL